MYRNQLLKRNFDYLKREFFKIKIKFKVEIWRMIVMDVMKEK